VYTEYPHRNHTSLQSLVLRCHELRNEDPTKAPTILFIKEGEHEVEEKYLEINYAMNISLVLDKTTPSFEAVVL
jgi:hypothetical protein